MLNNITLLQFQKLAEEFFKHLERRYSCKYGLKETFIHLVEEIGEVSRAIVNSMTTRSGLRNIDEEVLDSIVFLLHIASLTRTNLLSTLERKIKNLAERLGFDASEILQLIKEDKSYPPYPVAAVSAIIPHEDKILLIRRGAPPGEGYWALPGGAVEIGEYLIDAVKREVHEETGINIKPLKPLGIIEVLVLDNKGYYKFHYVINVWECKPLSLDVKPSSDVLDAKWLEKDAISRVNVSPACLIALECYLKGEIPFNIILKVREGRLEISRIV